MITPDSNGAVSRPQSQSEANDSANTSSYKRTAALGNTFAYMGSLMTFLVEGSETNQQFALMEYRAKPGNEPPPHLHQLEDEVLYIVESEIEAYQGDQVVTLGAGDCLFAPKGTPHAWYILSSYVRILIMVQPAYSDRYFRQMGSPTRRMELPSDVVTYAMSNPEHAISVGRQYGIKILGAEETKMALPKYPGFAVKKG
jgi:quercetin dioxygenase-like cupin family protein